MPPRLIKRDVRARGAGELSSCGGAAAETRWLCAQEERLRSAEAMQRRKKRGARNSLLCVLPCQKRTSFAAKQTERF